MDGCFDHLSFFDGLSASNLSTNFSNADASDLKGECLNGPVDPRTMTKQEILNRICRIWSNMSLV